MDKRKGAVAPFPLVIALVPGNDTDVSAVNVDLACTAEPVSTTVSRAATALLHELVHCLTECPTASTNTTGQTQSNNVDSLDIDRTVRIADSVFTDNLAGSHSTPVDPQMNEIHYVSP
ncbi:hypothetical protein ETTORE_0379 [Pseudomonas phage Ettore]|nr:hypothetical protein ETTORE_0379 [Pseudomonas phage Ettore]